MIRFHAKKSSIDDVYLFYIKAHIDGCSSHKLYGTKNAPVGVFEDAD